MILTFSQQCKHYGTSPVLFSEFCGVSKRTLGDWHHTKPLLIQRLFTAYLAQSLVDDVTGPRQVYQNKPSAAQ